jgi:pilus assembly protein CpaE
MIEARNNGIPLIEQAPKAPVTQSILALAEAITSDGKPAEEAAAKKSGLGRLFGFRTAKK